MPAYVFFETSEIHGDHLDFSKRTAADSFPELFVDRHMPDGHGLSKDEIFFLSQNEHFSKHRTKSVQEFRFELSQGIRSQIFFATFVKNVEVHIKSNDMTKALK